MVVTASRQGSRRIQRTLFSRRVPSRYRPKSSSPTEQHMAASNPFRAAAMATFAGGAPGVSNIASGLTARQKVN